MKDNILECIFVGLFCHITIFKTYLIIAKYIWRKVYLGETLKLSNGNLTLNKYNLFKKHKFEV